MAIKKITFTNANVTAQNDADLYYFLQGGTGILKGIKNEIKASNNANRFIFEDGYVSIYGRLLFVDNNTDITVPLNRTAMGYVVLDINTATNSAELTYTEATNGGYPALIQENLSTGAGRYQFPLAAYSKTGAALTPDQSFKPAYLYPHMERQQGASNAGKVLAVGADGYIILMNQSGINAGQLEGHPASYFQEKQEGKGLSDNNYDDTEKKKVQDNTTARHSHDNKSILDQVTQDIVNKADKLKFEGEKLSPELIPSAGINVESADKAYKDGLDRNIVDTYTTKDETTAVKNGLEATDNKNLYNLGAFDTLTENDNVVIITRKTGYFNLSKFVLDNQDNGAIRGTAGGYEYGPIGIDKDFLLDARDIGTHKVDIKTNSNFVSADDNQLWGNINGYQVNTRFISLPNSYTTKESYIQYFSENLIFLQYELATEYTEKVIKNQSLIDIPADGTRWLREEWEKGLNLFNGSRNLRDWNLIVGNTYTITTIDSTHSIKIAVNWPSGWEEGDILVESTKVTFTYNEDRNWRLFIDPAQTQEHENFSDYGIMCVEGSIAYPYRPYNGEIVHQKELEEIKRRLDELGFKEGVAETSNYSSVIVNSLKKQGKYVLFNFQGASDTGTSITIPEGFRPKVKTEVNGFVETSKGDFDSPIYIEPDGAVKIEIVYGANARITLILNVGWETA